MHLDRLPLPRKASAPSRCGTAPVVSLRYICISDIIPIIYYYWKIDESKYPISEFLLKKKKQMKNVDQQRIRTWARRAASCSRRSRGRWARGRRWRTVGRRAAGRAGAAPPTRGCAPAAACSAAPRTRAAARPTSAPPHRSYYYSTITCTDKGTQARRQHRPVLNG